MVVSRLVLDVLAVLPFLFPIINKISNKMKKKNTKVMYNSWAGIFEDLNGDDARRLAIALFKFKPNEDTIDDYFPIGDHLRTTFRPLMDTINYNDMEYKEKAEKNRENGRKGGLAKAANRKESIDTSTGEVFIPTDEPMTSELTVDPILEEEQPYTNATLSEFIKSRPEGMMQCPQWSGFVAMYPDAEKIQKISGITELSAVTLYSQLRKNAFAFGN